MAKGDFTRKYVEWMRGRNGVDDLARVTSYAALIVVFIALVSRVSWVSLLGLALLIYSDWRMLSKDIAKRARENERFMSSLGPLRPWVVSPKAAMAERKAYKHLACPNCGQKVRVPRGKGSVRVTCPSCHTKFEGKA
jgi:ribosomal protein L37AE/L43A